MQASTTEVSFKISGVESKQFCSFSLQEAVLEQKSSAVTSHKPSSVHLSHHCEVDSKLFPLLTPRLLLSLRQFTLLSDKHTESGVVPSFPLPSLYNLSALSLLHSNVPPLLFSLSYIPISLSLSHSLPLAVLSSNPNLTRDCYLPTLLFRLCSVCTLLKKIYFSYNSFVFLCLTLHFI